MKNRYLLPMLVIYKSSAGSGKTYRLVLEYLKIVLLNPGAYRHVLAITFTNKATEEMKNRIIETLTDLANGAQDSVWEELDALFQEKGMEKSVQDQARLVLYLILRDYSNFSVSTIESFFQRILRSFAKELNLPLQYEIEMQQSYVLERITEAVFLDVGIEDSLTRLLNSFVLARFQEGKNWRVDQDIQNLGQELFKERYQNISDEITQDQSASITEKALELAKRMWGIRREFETKMKELSKQAATIMQENGLEMGDFSYGKSGVGGYLLKFQHGAATGEDVKYGSRITNALEKDAWCSKKAPNQAQVMQAVEGGLRELLTEMVEWVDDGYARYLSALEVLKTLYSYGLIRDLQTKLQAYRQEHQQMMISDTNNLLEEIISEDDAPFIYEKVGNRYHYYLIDEFQDTSDLQWQNLRPLVMESLANGNSSLLVGDVKQSIYRWRSGNMDLLLSEVEEDILAHGQQVGEEQLTDNWRTAGDIVRFNNELFEQAASFLSDQTDSSKFRDAYQAVAQNPRKAKISGYVSMELFEKKGRSNDVWKEAACERTLDLIKELKAEGFSGSEITILVRTNGHGIELAEFLQKHEIQVVSSESLLIANYPQILFLESLLFYLHNDQDHLSLATANYYYELVIAKQPIDDASFRPEKESLLPFFFLQQKERLRQLPVYECVENLIRIFSDLLQPNAYLQGFLDNLLEYSSSRDASIAGFLEWWQNRKSKQSISSAAEQDAVQILTIHKSKGLEFPIVIMPYTDWSVSPNKNDTLWVKTEEKSYQPFHHLPLHPVSNLEQTDFAPAYREEQVSSLLDNLNLLYVAFTRPKYRLYAFMPQVKKIKSISSIYHLLQSILPDSVEGEWDEELNRFTRGKAVSKAVLMQQEKRGKSAQKSVILEAVANTVSDWDTSLKIRYSSHQYLKSGLDERMEKVETGELLHAALAYVEQASDLEQAIETLIRQGTIARTQAQQVRHDLQESISLPAIQNWFDGSWEVRNEADIITEKGKLIRPDRVMLKGNHAIVVDYKTGKEDKRYHSQLRRYMRALQQIGYAPVEGYLYYLAEGNVVEVR